MGVAKILTGEMEENTSDSGEEMSHYQYDLLIAQTRQRGDLVAKLPGIGRMSVKMLYFWNAPC